MTILKNLSKRGLALFLVLTMCLSVMQVTAFAADEEDTGSDPITEQIPETTDEVINETTDEVTDETTDEVTNETTDEVTDETTDEVTGETTDEVTDETTDEVTGETTDETTDETVDETETVVTASLEDEAVVAFLAAVESMEALQAQEDPDPDEYLAAMQKVLDCYDALSEEQKGLLEEDRAASGEEGTYAEMIATLWDGVNALTEGDGEGDNSTVVATVNGTGYETLQEAINAAQEDSIETVILLGNVNENVTVTGKITLDLAGFTLKGTGTGTVLTINGGDVTLTGDGTITGGAGKQGGGVFVKGNASFTLESGTITDNHVSEQGGGVFIDEGTFTMNGGTITKNTAGYSGGGVFVYNYMETKSAMFMMNGGTISYNTANGGAGVGAYGWKMDTTRTVAKLNGGIIESNTANQNGGGVAMECGDVPAYIEAQYGATGMNTIEINRVTIQNNTALNQGGGVWSCDSVLAIDGATIINNHAEGGTQGYGGGMYVQGGEATLVDVEITGNTAKVGGGLFAGHKTKDTIFAMTGGKLYGNTVTSHAADAYCNSLTTLTLPVASSMGGSLDGKSIIGWYWDSTGQYDWSKDYCVEQNMTVAKKAQRCLIAAYDLRDPVAMIVETRVEYTTLQAAVDAAKDGETVEVLKDTTGASLQDAKKVTVEIPEGLTVSTNSGKTYALAVAGAGAELTITGGGAVTGSTYGVVAQSGGKLNVTSGTITAAGGTTTTSSGKTVTISRAIYVASGASVNVSGGTIIGANKDYSDGIYATSAGTTVNVSGGEVKSDAVKPVDGMGFYANTSGLKLLNGAVGTVSGNAVINGGYTGISLGSNSKLTMTGGSATGTGYGLAGNGSNDNTTIEISGGSITGSYTAIYHPQVGDMTISGGTITGPNGVQYSGAGTLTISGGEITATLPYTEAPQKAVTQSDGTVSDGAALSIVSRGGGYQDEGQTMTVNITGGEFTSENNSAIAVYRIKKIDGTWQVGDATGLKSYLKSLAISGGIFTGNPEKGVLDIEKLAMDAKSVTGGYFNQDIDAGAINYVDDGYASHLFGNPSGYYNVHQPDMMAENEYGRNETNHWQGCKVSNCLEGKVEVLHTFGPWEIDTPAQPGVDGQRHRDCAACGYRETGTFGLLDISVSNVTADYDGQSHVVTPDVTLAGAAVSGAAINITYTDADGNSVSNPVNAGTYTAVITAALEGYTTAQNTAAVTINPRPLTVTTGSATVVYPAVAVNAEASITGTFAEGESATVTATGSQSGVGSSYNSYRITWGANTLAQNYTITAEEGTLTVNPAAAVLPPAGPTPVVPGGTTIADDEVPLAAPGLNSTDHIDYIKGYEDGTVRPEANITRAEVATIFFRLMTNEYRIENWSSENDFSDVESGAWYNNAISTATKAGLLKGYPDGSFLPGNSITRAEFATIAAGFASEEVTQRGRFSDIQGHWAEESIERAAAAGWIKGENGKFRPDAYITRAEVIVAVNRMLDRVPDADHLLDGMKTFVDNVPGMWYYADIQEATNSHEYERAEDGVSGIWTELKPDQDWAALEKEWANAADANVADVAGGLTGGSESEADGEGKTED